MYATVSLHSHRPSFFIAEPLFSAVPQVEKRLKNFVEILIDTYINF